MLEKKKKNVYVVCLSIEVITRGGRGGNAVEQEEGKKIGGLFFVFSFLFPMLRRIYPAAIGTFSA